MTDHRRRHRQHTRSTTSRFVLLVVLASPSSWTHGRSIHPSAPSTPCLDRAFRQLMKTSDGNDVDASTCEEPHLTTDFCYGPVGTTCRVDAPHGINNNRPRRPGPDTCSLVTHALWVESHFHNNLKRRDNNSNISSDIVVVVPAGTCRGPIRHGPFRQEWLERNQTLADEPVVTLPINGSNLLQFLERALELRHVLMQRDVQPRVSGMQFWVRPRRNDARIARPTVVDRSTCRWKPVQPSIQYTLVTVPSMIKQCRRRDDYDMMNANDDPLTPSSELSVVDAVSSYVRRACRVGDPSDDVSRILSLGGSNRARAPDRDVVKVQAVSASSSSSPVCPIHQSQQSTSHNKKKDLIHASAESSNRTYHHHSRLATW